MWSSVLKRVNQEVKAALEREEAGRQANKKHKYNTSFTSEDHAVIGLSQFAIVRRRGGRGGEWQGKAFCDLRRQT